MGPRRSEAVWNDSDVEPELTIFELTPEQSRRGYERVCDAIHQVAHEQVPCSSVTDYLIVNT